MNTVNTTQSTTITTIVYALHAASFFVGFTAIVAIIINYVKRNDVRSTWQESHFRWQIRTFWFSLFWTVLGILTWPLGIGMVILGVNFIWLVYRIAKGWLRLIDGQMMYV